MAIFNSIIQNEAAMVFRHHCDSQKRAKYKEMIKQHMDIETVRSRLVSCSIKSPVNFLEIYFASNQRHCILLEEDERT
uniref:Putative ovule protein n=1 Tax=Solanum chacoense TaxID=4108 RepID=A0A0V0GVC2_SOLCH